MQSFHQSRGRIVFDVLCAFGMSASCAWASVQTYATALLGAAAVAGLYGLVRFFDMFRRGPIVERAEPVVRPAVADTPLELVVETAATEAASAEPVPAAEAKHELPPEVVAALVRKPKRKAKRPVKAEAAEDKPAASEPEPEPEYSAPIAPLFQPEPFVRQQRAAFGRKFGAR